ncbi:hypothetical protein QRX60_30260 [Amycolatopsis mongoliensis]|uniref:ANTAR domain-containing protein n=1 Tax=Amycolatopsis mongoliensis TaxID=715475 RepID=A0A9Y2JIY9_9PSEU|nr:hypothetical protein [Amycolatopsis sp. 4-36]WIX98340.1 hypothetical protein QRX60_30260 [Amycolatopsis sp. 4-36]
MNSAALPSDGREGREAAAHRLLKRLNQRARLNIGVGILQVRYACDRQEATDRLCRGHDLAGQNTLADLAIAATDADADHRADPDAEWD